VFPALEGKVVAITGGTAGIGRAIGELFVAEGATVVVNGRNEARGKELLADLDAGDRAVFYGGSVLDQEVVEGLVDFTVERFGAIDVMVLNAGGSDQQAPVVDLTDEEWDLCIRWNLTHAFWGMRRALKYMIPRQRGRIIAMSSKQGKIGRAGVGGYVASKHGLNGLVKSAALEVGALGITVNAICPGSVLTDLVREKGAKAAAGMGLASLDELLAMHAAESAIKRQLTPEEVASLCLYIASDASAGITGQMLSVDGGVSPY
jgi:NAD(P)-dependent dehydrogenase (short-subunit alcohol dehydrogenase family)